MLSHAAGISKPLAYATMCIALLLSFTPANADTSVWKVSKGDSHIYLGGTVHVLSQSDYPLPKEFDEAYAASDVVVFETDITAMSNPANAQLLMSKLQYQDGSNIRDHLSPETIRALDTHFEMRGMSLEQFANFKPSMLYMALTMIELQIIGIDAAGVDMHFASKATADNKPQLMFETPEEQIDFIANIGADDPDQMLEYTLRDLANLQSMMDSLLDAWREGDSKSLDDQMIDLMAEDYPQMYQTLLVKRNNNWLPQLTSFFKTDEIEFVMVGAAHLVGEVGLLELLREAGYSVEQL